MSHDDSVNQVHFINCPPYVGEEPFDGLFAPGTFKKIELSDADMVNHPPHYTSGGVECIDAIEAALGKEQFIGFLRGQVIKYQWRIGKKFDSVEDSKKAGWYLSKLTEVLSR